MRILNSDEFADNFVIKADIRTKRIALIKLTGEDVQCTRIQFYTNMFNLFEKSYPDTPLPLRLYSDEVLALEEGWGFTNDECIDYLAE